MQVVILGAGTFAATVREWCRACGIQVMGFAVDVGPKPDSLEGLPVWWADNALPAYMVGGIFSTRRDVLIKKCLDAGHRFVKIVHPDSSTAATAGIDVGTVIGPGAVIEHHAHVGPHVVVNRGCLVGHDVRIDEFATLGPGANLAGNARVSRGAFVGMGVCVLPRVAIGEWAIVGAGAVVTRDVRPGATVTGVPARGR